MRFSLKLDAVSLTKIALSVVMVYILIPALQYLLPQIIRYLVLLVIYALPILAMLISKQKNKCIVSIALSFLHIVLYFVNNRSHTSTQAFGDYFLAAFLFWIPFILALILIDDSNSDYSGMFKLYLLVLIITTVTTIIGNISFPLASRALASSDVSGLSKTYKEMNIGGYGFIYGAVISIPSIWYKMTQSRKKLFYIILLIALYFMIFLSQYAIAIYLSLLFLIALVVFRSSNPIRVTVGVGVCVVLIVIFHESIANWILSVTNNLGDDYSIISVKLKELANYLLYGTTGTDSESRLNLYGKSIEAIFLSPVWGNLFTYHEIGGHSEYLDLLAASGIIGVAIYCLAIKNTIRSERNYFDYDAAAKRFFSITIILFTIIGFLDTIFLAPEVAISTIIVPLLVSKSILRGKCYESVMAV